MGKASLQKWRVRARQSLEKQILEETHDWSEDDDMEIDHDGCLEERW